MVQGAVAIVDALGFKGIYKRHKPREVIRALRRARDSVLANRKELNDQCTGRETCNCYAISDTLHISVRAIGKDTEPRQIILDTARILSRLIRASLSDPCPLIFRGAISYGDQYANGGYLVGPAVDDAASLFEQPEGAFVVLAPSATGVWRLGPCDPLLKEWGVPIKGGGSFQTFAVNPLAETQDAEFIAKTRALFDPADYRVQMKADATTAFLSSLIPQ